MTAAILGYLEEHNKQYLQILQCFKAAPMSQRGHLANFYKCSFLSLIALCSALCYYFLLTSLPLSGNAVSGSLRALTKQKLEHTFMPEKILFFRVSENIPALCYSATTSC